MTLVVWANGRIVLPEEPVVSALDHGLTVGDGVFESCIVTGGTPFALARHLERLHDSADRIGLAGIDDDAVRTAIGHVLAVGAGEVNRVRITVTSGPGPLGSRRGDGPLTLIVVGSRGAAPAQCRVVRAPWRRNEHSPLAGVKSTSYGEAAVIAQYARAHGADEAIIANTAGDLCEGSASNVFVELGGEVLTPPVAAGCLAGVSRALALEWGTAAGLPVRVAEPGELPYSVLDDVLGARAHLALSASSRGVQAVDSLDGRALDPGPLLAELSAIYASEAANNPNP